MDKMRPPMAKILVHSEGLGTLHADTVRKRAQELALINGHAEYTDEDWHQARLELHGAHHPNGELSEELGAGHLVSEADMLCTDAGHQVDRLALEDERNLVEELWMEGMEEAEHEQMLQAARAQAEEDEPE
jgi:hypothetical protein